ncbi:hypothetical protein I7I50_07373 [Histoplasma capsulatum G186AR]|uniref:Uncharacterized protein n=1 Tax=Ajellomyces capsulatus TaxID=5037 RepID=A0A8H7Z144_AJECA|nr:hypothetical protein I7I52_09555 [Histoplasma capsulatum]QSS68085.1 hypothetical protein I7I50_07373 [Histoplasma capsulatum G186AR]
MLFREEGGRAFILVSRLFRYFEKSAISGEILVLSVLDWISASEIVWESGNSNPTSSRFCFSQAYSFCSISSKDMFKTSDGPDFLVCSSLKWLQISNLQCYVGCLSWGYRLSHHILNELLSYNVVTKFVTISFWLFYLL